MRVAMFTLTVGALLLAVPAFAQPPRGRIIRTEIFNGGTHTVRYTPVGLSLSDVTEVKELERLDNEVSYLRGLNDLKRQYVNSESALEPQRRITQMQLYGLDITRTGAAMLPYGGLAGYGAVPAGWYGSTGWYGGYYGSPYLASGPGFVGGITTENRSLANGVGDEGALKASMSQAIARQATEEYAATVEKARDRVLARASESPALRVALNLPAPGERRPGGDIRTVGAEEKSGVLLTLKTGEKVHGTKVEERGAWFVVTFKGGRTLRLRESEVKRVEYGEGEFVKPAAGTP